MENFKILKVKHKNEMIDVLVFRDADQDGEGKVVNVKAILPLNNNTGDWWCGETVLFPDRSAAMDFIENFSPTYAKSLLKRLDERDGLV